MGATAFVIAESNRLTAGIHQYQDRIAAVIRQTFRKYLNIRRRGDPVRRCETIRRPRHVEAGRLIRV